MNLPVALAAQRPRAPDASLAVAGPMRLAAGRVHEFCGPARRSLALLAVGRARGPVFWIAPSWTKGGPNPCGFHRFLDPARVIFLSPDRPDDLLWTMEEALRTGIVPVVVADLPAAPGLTAVRRLHLAAETGGAEGAAPLGLLLLPGDGGARGVETRWWMAPRHHGAEGEGWRLERRRARTAPPAAWALRPGAEGWQAEPAAEEPA
jgi:protein ImuA